MKALSEGDLLIALMRQLHLNHGMEELILLATMQTNPPEAKAPNNAL